MSCADLEADSLRKVPQLGLTVSLSKVLPCALSKSTLTVFEVVVPGVGNEGYGGGT